MSSKLSSGLIAGGVLFAFLGLCVLPAALGAKSDPSEVGIAATLFSFGILLVAGGIYAKAMVLKLSLPEMKAAPAPGKRGRAGCELCGTEQPVVQCKVHQLQLCGTCLTRHYDHRSCSYIPSGWNVTAPRSMAARRNG
jgi:hypothetical protein